jgi:hypothetical protein
MSPRHLGAVGRGSVWAAAWVKRRLAGWRHFAFAGGAARLARLVPSQAARPLAGLFFLGVVAGLILDLTGKMVRVWGKDLGLNPGQMDRLSLLDFAGALRVLWAPLLMTSLHLCWTRHGQDGCQSRLRDRRAWVVICMAGAGLGLWALGQTSFLSPLFQGTLLFVIILFNSLDVLVIASQADAASKSLWGLSEGICINGYRFGMMASSTVALSLSHYCVPWSGIYAAMACAVLAAAGLVWRWPLFDFLMPKAGLSQPDTPPSIHQPGMQTGTNHLTQPPAQNAPSDLADSVPFLDQNHRVWKSLWTPALDWFRLPGSLWMISVMISFRWQDSLIDPQREYIMLAAGLSKAALAAFKSMAIWASVVGGLVSGALIRQRGHGWTLQASLLVHGLVAVFLASLVFSKTGAVALAAGLLLESTTKSMALVAFYAFQMVCCQPGKVVAQLALVSALGDLGYSALAMRSGFVAQNWGWTALFLGAAACNLPALVSARGALRSRFVRQALSEKS